MRRITTRLVACLLGLCAAAGLYVLGRVTADPGPYRTGLSRGYARGLDAGHAQGLQDGRADQETRALPPSLRDSAKTAYRDGYQTGANDAFGGYDGGWSYSAPYLITLVRGGPGITYRVASRTVIHPGVDYFLCPNSAICQRPHK